MAHSSGAASFRLVGPFEIGCVRVEASAEDDQRYRFHFRSGGVLPEGGSEDYGSSTSASRSQTPAAR